MALAADFDFDSGGESQGRVLRWRLGPYADGRWHLVFQDGVEAYEVPRRGAFHIGDPADLILRVRYDSPRGWSTYSPPLRLDFKSEIGRRQRFAWSRP